MSKDGWLTYRFMRAAWLPLALAFWSPGAFAFGSRPVNPAPPPPPRPVTHTQTETDTATATDTNTSTGRASGDRNETVCAQLSSPLPGTDVSNYDPGTSWSSVRKGGAGFAYIKATEGDTYVSPLFASDWAAAKNAGVLRGAYHFFRPGDDPNTQADEFLQVQGVLGEEDLPSMLDWEVTDGVSNAVQIASAQIWLEKVKAATGKTPVIYVDPSFYNGLGNPPEFFSYPLYIANYNVACPDLPPPWSKWVFWQNGIGPVTGVVSSQADRDKFNGTAAQLLNFAKTGAMP